MFADIVLRLTFRPTDERGEASNDSLRSLGCNADDLRIYFVCEIKCMP